MDEGKAANVSESGGNQTATEATVPENAMPTFGDERKTDAAKPESDSKTDEQAKPSAKADNQAEGAKDGAKADAAKDGAKADSAKDQTKTESDTGEKDAKEAANAFDQKSWDAYVDKIEGASDTDKAALKSFGDIAGKLGVSVENAGKLLTWAQEAGQAQREAYAKLGREVLTKEWGADYDKNIEKAVSVVALVDRELGDTRFKAAIERAGVGADPDFCKGLKYLAEQLGEDSLGAKSMGTEAGHVETSLEALKGMFK